jgi:hypothetical protein
MNLNLDTLRTEIPAYLEREGFVIYYGEVRQLAQAIGWDTRRRPDYQEFLKVATACGVKVIVFYSEDFDGGQVDEAMEDLESADLTEDEYRAHSRRLRELREYSGFTCVIELAFFHQGAVYLFHLHTDWFSEYLNIRNEIDEALVDEEEDGDTMNGYFSRN